MLEQAARNKRQAVRDTTRMIDFLYDFLSEEATLCYGLAWLKIQYSVVDSVR